MIRVPTPLLSLGPAKLAREFALYLMTVFFIMSYP